MDLLLILKPHVLYNRLRLNIILKSLCNLVNTIPLFITNLK